METTEQLKYIQYNGRKSIILKATAGSGKTHSSIKRLEYLLNVKNVNPSKILFLSFTNNAVNELRSRITHPSKDLIEIKTIHSLCCSVLGSFRKFRPIKTFTDFIQWYKFNKQPKNKKSKSYQTYLKNLSILEDSDSNIGGEISKFKILKHNNTKYRMPLFLKEYQKFLYEVKGIDFVDMLIKTYKLTDTKEWKDKFNNKYDNIFIDEYQDTSSLQMKICLAFNAKQYYLVGDENQQIFQFTGVSECNEVERLLLELHEVEYMTLSTNFRCSPNVVNYSNKYSTINAVSTHQTPSIINESFLTIHSIKKLIDNGLELVFLARTNNQLRELEQELLRHKIPFNYNNIINEDDIIDYYNGRLNKRKELYLEYYANNFDNLEELVNFVSDNKTSKNKCMTIHKSKGSEFPNVVLVNNFNSDVLEYNNLSLDEKELKRLSVTDKESNNIHYVGLTRSKGNLYFLNI